MNITALSYASAGVVYSALFVVLLARREVSRRGRGVLIVVAATICWALLITAIISIGARNQWLVTADALRAAVWISSLLVPIPGRTTAGPLKPLLVAALLGASAVVVAAPFIPILASAAQAALLLLTILGCLSLEQILRNATPEEKAALKPFVWTLAGLLFYDVFVFSDAILFEGTNALLWSARGFLAVLGAPFLFLAAKRNPDWMETLFVSREFVFYSTTLVVVGLYLIAMSIGGYVIREQSAEWGAAFQLVYLVAALAALVLILSSARLKAQLRVFISKHFYRNRYDYRDEWLRLIRTLSDQKQPLPIDQRSIKALCAIVDSDGGQLWLDRDGRAFFEPFAAWQAPFPSRDYAADSALAGFLSRHQWVVDTREYAEDPEHYQHAFRDAPDELPPDSLVVPLMHQDQMLGFARLNRPAGLRELNYEDHDLLKTAGRQVAAFLAHDLALAKLAETQQFDAYHKLSAFVMHDLKNLLAQQALLVSNAKKFRDRPGFFDDVITTVDSGVQRMRRLLQQLAQSTIVSTRNRVELNKLILRAVSACGDHSDTPCQFMSGGPLCWVRVDGEQLASVLMHVIQNAQDASPKGGTVQVSLTDESNGRVAIQVRDQGKGMTEEFVRRSLFKPFETTKGATGMGIGAFQARELVRAFGGELSVTSAPGRGTLVTIVLPKEDAVAAEVSHVTEDEPA